MEKFCQNCRQSNSAEAQFCRFCASPLAPAQSGGQQPDNPPQNRRENFGFQNNKSSGGAASGDGASSRAIGSLALTIGGLLLCCVLTSIPGAILGWMEVNAIKQGQSSPKGMMMAQVGLWGGVAMTVINIVAYIFFFFFFILSAAANG